MRRPVPAPMRALLRELRLYQNPAAGEGPRLLSMDARRRIYLLLRRAGARAGLDIVRRGIYSPVPDVWALPEEAWSTRASMAGVEFDLDAAMALLDGPLLPYLREFRAEPVDDGYVAENGLYGDGVADVLYAVVRHWRPRQVLELGSGYSSLVIARALSRNRREGAHARHRICDPYPSALLEGSSAAFEVDEVGAESVPPERFADLDAGDVLFVDTSHTVKPRGDVNHIVLEGLPRLRPGVLVHFHDIFLPYDYPASLSRDGGLFWQEQYLLHGFLAMNPGYEVLLPMAAMHADRRSDLERVLPSLAGMGSPPSAFWARRREV